MHLSLFKLISWTILKSTRVWIDLGCPSSTGIGLGSYAAVPTWSFFSHWFQVLLDRSSFPEYELMSYMLPDVNRNIIPSPRMDICTLVSVACATLAKDVPRTPPRRVAKGVAAARDGLGSEVIRPPRCNKAWWCNREGGGASVRWSSYWTPHH